jgi:hypothetical protein
MTNKRNSHNGGPRIPTGDFVFVISPPTLFVVSLIYSLALVSRLVDHVILSFIYSIIIVIVGFLNISRLKSRASAVSIVFVLSLVIAIHLGFLVGLALLDSPSDFLWVDDTLRNHLPGAIVVSDWLDKGGTIEIFDKDPFKTLYLSSIWVGAFFHIFGVSPIVSSLATIPIKLLTVLCIFKAANNCFEDRFVALTAAIVYALMPSVTYFTLLFLKEFLIQFYVALALYILSVCIKKAWMCALLLFPLGALFVDRFYVAVALAIGFYAYYFRKSKSVYVHAFAAIIVGVAVMAVFDYYFRGMGVRELIETASKFEEAHNEGVGVTPTINIWVDLFRITFTPFFSLSNVKGFFRIDSLLIFGTFLHQIVMILYFVGLARTRKSSFAILNISLGMVLVLFAIIAPYNARARDSFYPLIAIFAAIGIATSFGNRVYSNNKLLMRVSNGHSRAVHLEAT